MKILLLPLIIGGLALVSCTKKEATPPNPHQGMTTSKAENPHAGMDMSGKEDPHAGMDMSKGADPHAGMDMSGKDDPHAGMKQVPGMGGIMGAPTPDMKAEVASDGMLKVGKLTGKLPGGWKSVPPASAMRLAQMELPASSPDTEPGELTLFYLGTDAGGLEANIDRWYTQFSQPDGKPTKEKAERHEIKVGDLKATMIKFPGTMSPSMMPGAPGSGPREGWMNLSAIVETPEGPFFFKGTGPVKTMKSHEKALEQFVKSLSFQK